MKHLLQLLILLTAISTFGNYHVVSGEPLSFYIDTTEGSANSKRRINSLQKYLNDNQCLIESIETGTLTETEASFIFAPLARSMPAQYKLLVSIQTLNNEPLSASIVVRGSTGIKNLAALANTHIAFLTEDSKLGYQLPVAMFEKAGVIHHKDKITHVDTNFASVSLLLHKDVFTSIIATPLAKKWSKSNNLTIVATSEQMLPGGIWVHSDINEQVVNTCQKAFTSMSRSYTKDRKLMTVFPYWVTLFH